MRGTQAAYQAPLTTLVTSTQHRTLYSIAVMVVASLFLAICAQISIPMIPVPVTLQTFAVMVIGLSLPWRLAGGTILMYIAEGACGLPVFSNYGSIANLMGPTAGYIVGFLPMAVIISYLCEKGGRKNLFTRYGSAFLGTSIMFVFGVGYLSTFIGFEAAVAKGLLPFIMGDFAKLGTASLAVTILEGTVRRFR